MQKKVCIVIKANQEFIRHTGEDVKKNAAVLNNLFESISDVYIPMLRMIDKLNLAKIPCRFAVVLPPVLCNLLSDDSIQTLYIDWLNKKNELGLSELERNKNDSKITQIIKSEIYENEELKQDFEKKYQKNLIEVFSKHMKNGTIEILGTCGTEIFMPHYIDMKEVLSAQIECGLYAYRQYFGVAPEGFWLPDFGYAPGVEKLIRAYGYTYTILDARSILFAEKIPETGIFYPSRTENSLVVFCRDNKVDEELYGYYGYLYSVNYRNQNRDIGYDLPIEELAPFIESGSSRYSTGFKYWNRWFKDESKSVYDKNEALKQVEKDAEAFVANRKETLNKAAELLPNQKFVAEICTFDVSKMNRQWHECILWLENIFRAFEKTDIEVDTCCNLCEDQYNLEKVEPYYSAGIGEGYGENLLSSKNCWMARYIKKACERMVDLADRFPNDTGLKTRLLNLGAKELLLAQSSNLADMIDKDELPEFAERRFRESITAFTTVFDSLGSNTVSTEWLTKIEMKDSVFLWMNYRIFSRKK